MFDEEYYASEDSVVMNCDPCQFEGTQKDARAFCHECNEFLCQQCLQSHRKFQAFRHHNILRGDSIPRTRDVTNPKLALKFCDDHQLNEVQFYCSTHKSVLCSLCKMAKHTTCDCKLIEEICEKDDLAKFYNAVKEIEVIKAEFEQFKSVQIEVIDSVTANSKSQRAMLDSVRKEMNEFFDKLENEITDEEADGKFYAEELRGSVAMYTDAINHIASLQDHIDYVSKSNDKVAIFAAKSKLKKIHGEYMTVKDTVAPKPKTKKSGEVIKKILTVKEICDNFKKKMDIKSSEDMEEENEEKYENVQAEISEGKFTDLEEFSKSEIKLNETDDNRRESSSNSSNDASSNDYVKKTNLDEPKENGEAAYRESTKEQVHHPRDANAREVSNAQKQEMLFENLKIKNIFYKAINFKTSDSVCDVTGSLFLPDGSLVLCDHANSKLILLDEKFQMLHILHCEGSLWDVALVNANEIIVSVMYQKLLQYVKVESGSLHKGRGINLKRMPWGIAVYKDNILITFHNNPGNGFIEVRDRCGNILRNITFDEDGEELFASPFYITVNQHNGDIYVSDGRENRLTCLTFEGKLLYKLESDEFKWPRKLILDDHGNCLLCASFANKILLIKNKLMSPLQSKEEKAEYSVLHKKCKRPQTVSVRWEDQTVIVGLNKMDIILALK